MIQFEKNAYILYMYNFILDIMLMQNINSVLCKYNNPVYN